MIRITRFQDAIIKNNFILLNIYIYNLHIISFIVQYLSDTRNDNL